MSDSTPSVSRVHRARLMQLWRSAGWPCRDPIEIDLLAAGLVVLLTSSDGRETLSLTSTGIQVLADARQRNQRSLGAHDRLAQRVAGELLASGRVVWLELSLRARVSVADGVEPSPRTAWRMARPDVFSVRNTSVQSYLQPCVHEIKVSRADLLSDLRHEAKRQSYQWLCCECYYVFPAGVAEPEEIPEPFGVWVLHGDIETGRLDMLRPARHSPCELPFSVWMALAKAAPVRVEREPAQGDL